ncbi:hypothetical protein GALL_199810 [mine drainage metagenome]|uniref:TonB C-terminal domain-containing protein n=1 Tax=mine drainage metagenome TaxID=410659 RepID=A0A1J5S195_9ZZZZ
MPFARLSLACLLVACCGGMRAAVTTSRPVVTAVPFEPAYQAFYDGHHKYRHPGELVPPEFVVPEEGGERRCCGDVVVLVTVDCKGRPVRLAVLYATNAQVIQPALRALERTRWTPGRRPVAFYYDARF